MKPSQTKILGAALLLGGLALCSLGLSLLLEPPEYQATLRLEYEQDTVDFGNFFEPPSPTIQEMRALISSPLILSNVVNFLSLPETGRLEHAGQRKNTLDETVAWLSQRVEVTDIRGTRLIAIRFTSEDPNEAADVAKAVAASFNNYLRDYLIVVRKQSATNEIEALQQEYRNEEKQILVAQAKMQSLRRTLNITNHWSNPNRADVFPDAFVFDPENFREKQRQLDARAAELQQDLNQLSAQYHELKMYDRQKLRQVLPAITRDTILQTLLDELRQAQPETTKSQPSLEELNRQIDDRMDGIMAGLGSQVETRKAGLEALTNAIAEAKYDLAHYSSHDQPYYDARARLDHLICSHKLSAVKIEAMKDDLSIPSGPIVQIVDPVITQKTPLGSDFFLGAVLLAIGLFPTTSGALLLKSSGSVGKL